MAPSARPSKNPVGTDEDDSFFGIQKSDRKIRKPLVEKKRRARINESLQELRGLLADTDFHAKMENAEVLELTVKKVEDILKNRNQESERMNREASERFAAGYIQCMHEVHMFVSSCPGIDATVAAELLNHLLECMPLNEDHLQDVMDLISDTHNSSSSSGSSGTGSTWANGTSGDSICSSMLASPGGRSAVSALSPAPSTISSEDLCSDLDETDSEHNQSSTESIAGREGQPTVAYPWSMWRPW
ncbi:hairy-related 13 [Boleophthalmus pectinirostris]|uniref:hairy-related 13 n=1 Tax=Boleophthalmus pectinirostris TaxID=150288 RepID=UPI000A1C6740|nr:hairy-related 13 [Boleophthalmus pectinirostris]